LTHLQVTSRGYVAAIREFARLGLPWLALGGGGYDLSAVARCWALAYGVMLDVEWPDQMPAAFARQYGPDQLRDSIVLEVPSHIRQNARQLAEDSVAAIKEVVFPYYTLAG
jgi:acetoin utilization protein AcuC